LRRLASEGRRERHAGEALIRLRGHGYIDVFENLPWSDAQHAVGRFDQIIALAPGVLAAQRIGEAESVLKLFGFDQKAGAVGDPFVGRFHGVLSR